MVKGTFLEQLKYSFYVIFHPFDGFYEVKIRDMGSAKIATLFYILYAILSVIRYQYTGFLVNPNYIDEMNSIYVIFTSIAPLLLFVIGNWSITTLFEGKGRLYEIYTVIGYALIPHILFMVVSLAVSNVVTPDETAFYTVIEAAGYIWFIFLALIGLIVIHEFTLMRTITTIFVTFISMIFIIFIVILIIMLSQQIYEFITVLYKELVIRLGE